MAAVGAYARVVAEVVRAGMALDARDAEVAGLTQALTARVWVEQAKGHWVATEGLDPAEARAAHAEAALEAAQQVRVRGGWCWCLRAWPRSRSGV